MSKISYDKKILYIIISMMILVPSIKLLSYILLLSGVIADSFIVNQVYVLWVYIPILLATYIYGIVSHKIKPNYVDYIIYGLIIMALISTFWSINFKVSLFGEYHRNEGLLSLLNYYLVFLNCKNIKDDKDKNKIINCFFILGVVQVIYAILQIYTAVPFVKRFTLRYLAMGLCGNPNFLGSYMVMLSLLSSSFYLTKGNIKYLLLTLLYIVGLCLAQSTGPFIGFILAFILLIILAYKKDKLKQIIILVLTVTVTFLCTNASSTYLRETKYNDDLLDNYNIIKDLQGMKDNDFFSALNKIGNGRIKIWSNLLPLTKRYYAIGSGLDTIRYIYPQNSEEVVDKAHNVYLQILLTNGIYALLLYLGLCLNIFLRKIRAKDSLTLALFIAFVGYSIQAFANISVIDVAPYFFIILGLLYYEDNHEKRRSIFDVFTSK